MKKEFVMVYMVAQGTEGQRKRDRGTEKEGERERERERERGRRKTSVANSRFRGGVVLVARVMIRSTVFRL